MEEKSYMKYQVFPVFVTEFMLKVYLFFFYL